MNSGRPGRRIHPVGPSWSDRAHGTSSTPPHTGFRTRIRLRQVLEGATFPAERWQLIAWADHYGADGLTRQDLHGLPVGRYETVEQVIRTIERRAVGTTARPPTLHEPRVPRGPFGGPAVA